MDAEIKMNLPPNESKLPRNVKQIGDMDKETTHIYMEDYVYTYLYQYAKSDVNEGRIALLVGEKFHLNGQDIVTVSGAIQAHKVDIEENRTVFTVESWNDVQIQLKEYFNDKTIVGWMSSQPGYGVFMTAMHQQIHSQYFSNDNQILFLIDPIEKNEGLYVWKEDKLNTIHGYFIYYDRNEQMHRYMIENRINEKDTNGKERQQDAKVAYYRSKTQQKKEDEHVKRMTNMMVSLSAVLFVFCLIMGVMLIRNDKRLNDMEARYTTMYKAVMGNNIVNDNVGSSGLNQTGDKASLNTKNSEDTIPINEIEELEAGKTIADDKKDVSSETDKSNVNNNDNDNSSIKEEDRIETSAIDDKETMSTDDQVIYDVPESYTIQPGDDLISISINFYGTTDMVDRIKEVNSISNVNKIYAGKKLVLPKN